MISTSPWDGLTLVHQITEGNRNEVWQGELRGSKVAVRVSRRPLPSLEWELDLVEFLVANDFLVPQVIRTDAGDSHGDGIVVQQWIDGREPDTEADWLLVAAELRRLHEVGASYPQRPGCCSVGELINHRISVDANLDAMPLAAQQLVLDEFALFDDAPVSLIHGDPWAPNLRIVNGRVGLLDWDESRVDLSWHDLSNLGVPVLDEVTHARAERLSNAWEAANGWIAEPDYASRRLKKLMVSETTIDL